MPTRSPLEKAQAQIRKLNHGIAEREDHIRAVNNARLELEKELCAARAELQEERRKNTLLNVELSTVKQYNKDLEEEVKKERGRVTQALDIAEESSIAAGSIGRLANGLSMTLQAQECALTALSKERRR